MKSIIYISIFQFFFILSSFGQTTLAIENSGSNAGGMITIPIILSADMATDIAAYQFSVEWDASQLTFVSISDYEAAGLSSNDFGDPSETGIDHQLVVGWQDYSNPIAVDGDLMLFKIQFQLANDLSSEDQVEIKVCDNCTREVYDHSLSLLTTACQSGFVAVGSLPLRWVDFSAKVINAEQVQLKWAAADASNNSHFVIERSQDARSWAAIGEKAPSNASNLTQRYKFVDAQPLKGETFYRIKQVDFNGASSYTNVQSVVLGFNNIIFENPVREQLELQIQATATQQLPITLFDNKGQLLDKAIFQLEEGYNQLQWSLENIPSGIYLLKTGGAVVQSFKLIKK